MENDEADREFWSSDDLEKITGTPSSTWRYWELTGEGPDSFKIGRRRVWRKSVVLQWLAVQEAAAR